jgi:hypothetical protein
MGQTGKRFAARQDWSGADGSPPDRGALVKTGPAIVLMVVGLAILPDR